LIANDQTPSPTGAPLCAVQKGIIVFLFTTARDLGKQKPA
jgi:hypothetical protein